MIYPNYLELFIIYFAHPHDFYTSFIHLFLYHLLTLYIHKISSFVVTTKRDLITSKNMWATSFWIIPTKTNINIHTTARTWIFIWAEAPNYLTALRFFVALFRNFYRKRGLEIVRIKRRRFPSINVAFRLKLSKHVIF